VSDTSEPRLPDIGRRQQPDGPHTFRPPVQATGDDFTLTREIDSPPDRQSTPRLFEEES
jgi:hypothetical protein